MDELEKASGVVAKKERDLSRQPAWGAEENELIRGYLVSMLRMPKRKFDKRYAPNKLDDLSMAEILAYDSITQARSDPNTFAQLSARERIVDRTEGKPVKRIEIKQQITEETAVAILRLEKIV